MSSTNSNQSSKNGIPKDSKQNFRQDVKQTGRTLQRAYLTFTWKRCFGRLGRLLAGLVLLGMICAVAIYGLSFVNKKNDTAAASRFNVVFVMPKNAGIHYSLALGMVSKMESLSSMVTIKQTTSEEEARAMLESGEVKATVIIPEGMIHTIMDGTNDLPARILYPGDPSIETVIFRQIVDSLSQMVASSQTGVYALYEIYDDFDATEKQQNQANSQLNDAYITTILDRASLFSSVQTGTTTASSSELVLTGYLCSGLALLFLVFGINLCFFFVAPNRTVPGALTRLGLSHLFCMLADLSAAIICEWMIFLAACVLVGVIGSVLGFVPAFFIGRALLSSLICAIFSCTLTLFICRVCHGKQACVITTFAISLLIMYSSGCLIPAAFLPDMLRRISASLPGSQLKAILFWQFGQALSGSDIAMLCIEAVLLTLAASLLHRGTASQSTLSRKERRSV